MRLMGICASKLSRKRCVRWTVCAVACLLAVGVALLALVTHRQKLVTRRTTSCNISIHLLARALASYVDEYRALPYSQGQPEVTDPYWLFGPGAVQPYELWEFHRCPAALEARQGDASAKTGYLMWNLRQGAWRGLFLLHERGTLGDLPLLWCAEPVHYGGRHVILIPRVGLQDDPSVLLQWRKDGRSEEQFRTIFSEVRDVLGRATSVLPDGDGQPGPDTPAPQ